jgi:hypothetical protein
LKSLSDYIILLDNVMPLDMCDQLIRTYDSCDNVLVRKNDTYNFCEVNMLGHPAFEPFRKNMMQLMQAVHNEYDRLTGYQMPETSSYEAPRIKKYEPNEGIFDWHIDCANIESSRRMLVMFWYLNTVEVGGHTAFDIGGEIEIPPKAGRVLCFPPNFMYKHKGAMPISGPKYVISSYVNLP